MNENYLSFYEKEIIPKLKEIDISLKENKIISLVKASNLLSLSIKEILEIMEKNNFKVIKKYEFLTIMKDGSSTLCKMFSREINRKSKDTYTVEELSYIHNIDSKYIENACDFLEISQITENKLKQIFAQVPIK